MSPIQRVNIILFALGFVFMMSYLVTDSFKEMMNAFGFIAIFVIGTSLLLMGSLSLIINKHNFIEKIGKIPNALVFFSYKALLSYIAILFQISLVFLSIFICLLFIIWLLK